MSLEVGFIDGHALDPDRTLIPREFDHPIDEEEGVAMRDDLQDLSNVKPRVNLQESAILEFLKSIRKEFDQLPVCAMTGPMSDDVSLKIGAH
jgi:hypothetical protein